MMRPNSFVLHTLVTVQYYEYRDETLTFSMYAGKTIALIVFLIAYICRPTNMFTGVPGEDIIRRHPNSGHLFYTLNPDIKNMADLLCGYI